MFSATNVAATTTVTLAAAFAILGPRSSAPSPIPFDEARIFLEYNATDDDAEVVVDIDADVGLQRLVILGPNGEQVLDLGADSLGLGLRKFALETPEPSLQEVLDAFPAGNYRFQGRSVDGQFLSSVVYLSHRLPEPPIVIYPPDGDTSVPTSGASAVWASGGPLTTSFFLEIESDDLGVDVKANTDGSATSFGFPESWLEGGIEYQLGVAARADNDNLTVVELHFTTLP